MQPPKQFNVSLRVFDNFNCGNMGMNACSYNSYTPCVNYSGPQLNVPPNGSSQVFLPGTVPHGISVGGTIDGSTTPYYANGGTITSVTTGQICTGPCGASPCNLHTIITIDTTPTASPPFNMNNMGGLPFDNEAGFIN